MFLATLVDVLLGNYVVGIACHERMAGVMTRFTLVASD